MGEGEAAVCRGRPGARKAQEMVYELVKALKHPPPFSDPLLGSDRPGQTQIGPIWIKGTISFLDTPLPSLIAAHTCRAYISTTTPFPRLIL